MNPFDFAIQMEKDGESFYRTMATKAGSKGIAAILNRLADDEVQHQKVLAKMKEEAEIQIIVTNILKDAKNIFVKMQEEEKSFDFAKSDISLYQKARELEEKSEKFYIEKAKETQHEYVKNLFLNIAEEEKRHIFLLEHILEFINRPSSWIENAEFHHLEEY